MPTFYNFRENGLDYSFDDIFVPANLFRNSGNLWTWGPNNNGVLGNGGISLTTTPITIFAGGTDWEQVSNGGGFVLAIKSEGTLWGWGSSGDGKLGNAQITGSNSTPVTTFAGGTDWKQVSAGSRHAAAIKTDGTLWTWGYNGKFAIPNRDFLVSTPVTTFTGGINWKQVSCGYHHTAAIKTDGTLWTWGYCKFGQLGKDPVSYVYVPYPVTTFAGGTNWADTPTSEPEDLYTLVAGNRCTAAIKTDGTLWTWGSGTGGKIGNANTTDASTPVTTFAGGTDWKQISAGFRHAAAIKTDGTLWTWGYSGINEGVLGINIAGDYRSTPVTTFAGGTDWKQVSCAYAHAAAIKTDGTLWTWGNNADTQLGNSLTALNLRNVRTPITTFIGGTDWKQVSAGGRYTAAIKTDGTLWTWGNNYRGQLGWIRPDFYRSTPVTTFAGGTNWADTPTSEPEDLYTLSAANLYTAAIKTDGTLWTWGDGTRGQLGNAVTTAVIDTPVTTFAGGTNWKQVIASFQHTAAIKTDGTLWTWGNSFTGRLGNGVSTITSVSTPITTFAGGTNWKQVNAGNTHTAAIKTDGTLWTWGNGGNGRLGNTQIFIKSTPITTFAGGTDWKQVSCGTIYTAAIKTDGTLWVWGNGNRGTLGNATTTTTNSTPVTTFAGGNNWKQVSAGSNHTAAIKTDGTLWVWGNGNRGTLGNATTTTTNSTPVTTFAGGTDWKQVSCGTLHTAAIKTDGTLWTWGYGAFGRLGNATTTLTNSTPVTTFAGGTDWKQVSAGDSHTAALKDNGVNKELFVFGNNQTTELGVPNIVINQVFGNSSNWKQVSSGFGHATAIKTDGTLWVWGLGSKGTLGNNTTATSSTNSTPVTTFAGGTDWKQVSASSYHTTAIKTDGTLWTWGDGSDGKLGNNIFNYSFQSDVFTYAYTPVTTFAGGTDWKQVSAGYKHTIALRDNGVNSELFVWGNNDKGQLGNAYDEESNRVPSKVFGEGTDWKQVDCGYHITSAVKTDGTLWIWGRAQQGGLGIGGDLVFNKITPVTTFAGGTNWKQVSVGGYYSIDAVVSAIKTDGTLWVWGNTIRGILGNGMIDYGAEYIADYISTPITTFAGGTNWKYVSSGGYHRMAIKADGTLWTWGTNYGGQLGNTTFDDVVSTPITTFAGGTNWKQIDLSFGYNSAAVTYDDLVI